MSSMAERPPPIDASATTPAKAAHAPESPSLAQASPSARSEPNGACERTKRVRDDAPASPPRGRRRLALTWLAEQLDGDAELRRELSCLGDARLGAAAERAGVSGHTARVMAATVLISGDDATRTRVSAHLKQVREGGCELDMRLLVLD